MLVKALDGHINRGGEFEKRAAFVPIYNLPAGATKGLAAGKSGLYVFGDTASPALPSGVAYQRLQTPTATEALVSIPSYDLYGGKIYAVAEFDDGSRYHFYDGTRVADWFDGRARAAFRILDGVAGGSPSTLSDLKVDGVSIISAPVVWATSNANTASLIAAAINSYSSTPEYTATAVGDTVNIVAATSGTAANGRGVTFTVINGLDVSPLTGLSLADGADTTTSFIPGTFVKTIGSRVHSVSGENEHFSGIKEPTKWTTDTTGAGAIDMSTQASGSETLTSLAKYQQYVAVFAERVIQIWNFDSDPTQNTQRQVLNNTGTASPRSVTQFGDNDLFYLDESGLRSLKARDASNAAATSDIGVPVDSLITSVLQALSAEQRSRVIGLIEPRDGRFWLIMGSRIFVFSFFGGAKISAWSEYTASTQSGDTVTTFEITDAVVFQRRVYVRAGDTIYVYGGTGVDLTYDDIEAEAWLPYLDANTPTRAKAFEGVDAAVTGTWEVRVALDPTNLSASDKVATISKTTYGLDKLGGLGRSTHIGLRFKSKGSGAAKVSSAVIHYAGEEDED